jgi:hypothetical protein
MIPINLARPYLSMKLTDKAAAYQKQFFDRLKECAVANGGSVSRNGHRVIFPWIGSNLCPSPDVVGAAGNYDGWPRFRNFVNGKLRTMWWGSGKKWITDIDYIPGVCTVEYKNGSQNQVKIGKLLVKENLEWAGAPAINLFNSDPARLGKDIEEKSMSGDLCIIISDHAYDIAGMSYDRSWTSCMNIADGDCKEMVECDIHHGTLVAYLCGTDDTNINRPYARFLIKPYKLQRRGYTGFSPCQMIYYPERTVYSVYVGLSPLLRWGEAICKTLQSGSGLLRKLPWLYEDTCREKEAVQRKFEGYVKNAKE